MCFLRTRGRFRLGESGLTLEDLAFFLFWSGVEIEPLASVAGLLGCSTACFRFSLSIGVGESSSLDGWVFFSAGRRAGIGLGVRLSGAVDASLLSDFVLDVNLTPCKRSLVSGDVMIQGCSEVILIRIELYLPLR